MCYDSSEMYSCINSHASELQKGVAPDSNTDCNVRLTNWPNLKQSMKVLKSWNITVEIHDSSNILDVLCNVTII